MKKLVIALLALAFVFTALLAGGAAAQEQETETVGPYEGEFEGTARTSRGAEALLTLDMTHRGRVVEGTASLDEPLPVSAGLCGTATIPADSVRARGETEAGNPQALDATASFAVRQIPVTIELTSTIEDEVIDVEARVDLPWFCGHDPLLTAELEKVEPDGAQRPWNLPPYLLDD